MKQDGGSAMAHKTRDNVFACVCVCVCLCVCVCVCVILYSVYNLPIILFVETLKHAQSSVRKRGGWGEGGGGGIPLHIEWPVRDWLIRLNGVGRRPKQNKNNIIACNINCN